MAVGNKGAKSKFEYKRVFVYVMKQRNGDFIKVGQSIHPEKRKKELEWNGPKELELLHTKLFYSRERALAYEAKILENLIEEEQGVARNGRFCEWFLCSNAVKKIMKENYAMPILPRGRIKARR